MRNLTPRFEAAELKYEATLTRNSLIGLQEFDDE